MSVKHRDWTVKFQMDFIDFPLYEVMVSLPLFLNLPNAVV
jgi:hypothetical protein